MKLFWKTSGLGLYVCGLLFTGAIFTGCHSASSHAAFHRHPPPPTAAEVARFYVGDNVIVTLTGLPQDIPAA